MNPELLLERFELTDRLGAGGFGTVYRAIDRRLQRDVAVKIVEAGSPAERARARREAVAAARLTHPGIVALYELGEQDGRAVLVSELVEGDPLSELAREGALSDRDVAEVAAEVAAALAHAHARGVVHRDVKPSNILVEAESGRGKLTDFGTAALAGSADLTASGAVMGTIAYMAPEQADGRGAAEPADVYSLALTAYELLAGDNPIAMGTPARTARRIGRPVPSLGSRRPDLPRVLVAAVDAALAPDPEARPSARDLREAFTAALPLLDTTDCVRPVPPRERAARALALDGTPGLRAAVVAGLVALAAAAGLRWVGGGPEWAWLLAAAAGPLWIVAPRATSVLALAGLAWAAIASGAPGKAVLIGAAGAPGLAAMPFATRALAAPLAAPFGGLVGIPVLGAAAAGLACRPAARALLGVAGAWMLVVVAAAGGGVGLPDVATLPPGWEGSATRTIDGLFAAITPELAGLAAVWGVAAVALPVAVRGRSVVVDILGALVWCAALVTAQSGLLGGEGTPPWPLAALLLAVLVPAAVRRRASRVPMPSAGPDPVSAYD